MAPEIIPNKINSRAKLDTGTQCQARCQFCYYIDKLDEVTSFEIIKDRIDKIYEKGISEIDLSGGESSIHKDWFKILEYCNSKFTNISTLSNGFKFADYEFTEKSFNLGLKEVLFSLHGWDEKSHDNIVGRNKAFSKLLQGIQNCHIVGIKVRLNCTVTDYNSSYLEEYAKLISKLEVAQINFLPLNYWSAAKNNKPVNYEILSKGIHKAIDILKNKNIQINVRYIPFCFMKGYEKYTVGTLQHIFDLEDWNIAYYENGLYQYPKDLSLKEYYKIAIEKINYTYNKPKECFECKYFNICDGIEKVLKNQKVYPIKGKKILNPMEFRDGKRS
jgi:MoaA/NifB/PqqE/SkfB family radical SAM enzyme